MAGVITEPPVWTSAAGAYAPQVAEHALALLLAAARALPQLARAGCWTQSQTSMLTGSTVGLFGASATSRVLVRLLAPLRCQILGVSDGGELPGVERIVRRSERASILPECDYVVLTTSLTAQTAGLIGAEEFALMKAEAWIVNVARGGLIRTDDLVAALAAGRLGGAALDVTDPEPLPEQHPLWGFDNVLITPHCANPRGAVWGSLAVRVRENVARFAADRPLLGRISPLADPEDRRREGST